MKPGQCFRGCWSLASESASIRSPSASSAAPPGSHKRNLRKSQAQFAQLGQLWNSVFVVVVAWANLAQVSPGCKPSPLSWIGRCRSRCLDFQIVSVDLMFGLGGDVFASSIGEWYLKFFFARLRKVFSSCRAENEVSTMCIASVLLDIPSILCLAHQILAMWVISRANLHFE